MVAWWTTALCVVIYIASEMNVDSLSVASFQAKVKFFDWTKCDLCKLLIDFNGLLAVLHLLLCLSQCTNAYIGDLMYAVCYMWYASASGMIGSWTACKHCPLPIYYHEKPLRAVGTEQNSETMKHWSHTLTQNDELLFMPFFHCNVPKQQMSGHNSSSGIKRQREIWTLPLKYGNRRFRYDWDSRRREKNSKQTKRIASYGQ